MTSIKRKKVFRGGAGISNWWGRPAFQYHVQPNYFPLLKVPVCTVWPMWFVTSVLVQYAAYSSVTWKLRSIFTFWTAVSLSANKISSTNGSARCCLLMKGYIKGCFVNLYDWICAYSNEVVKGWKTLKHIWRGSVSKSWKTRMKKSRVQEIK